MLHAALLEGDGPVGRVVAHRRGNGEGARQLGVHLHLVGGVQVVREARLAVRVGEDVVLDALLAGQRRARVLGHALGEDRRVVLVVDGVVLHVVDHHGRLLAHDELGHLGDELLGVLLVERILLRVDAREDRRHGAPRDARLRGHLAQKVVGHGPRVHLLLRGTPHLELPLRVQLVAVQRAVLRANGQCVGKLAHDQVLIDAGHGVLDQLAA